MASRCAPRHEASCPGMVEAIPSCNGAAPVFVIRYVARRERRSLWERRIMHWFLIAQGAQAPYAALTVNRVALGVFFAISGYHKLFNASRHATISRTLQDDGVHALPIMQWLVPSIEFAGGWALILGLLSVLAAFGLFVICGGAVALDAVKRIRPWQPLDRADWLGDLLYLPESLYCIGLVVVMLGGPGPWSLDAAVVARLGG